MKSATSAGLALAAALCLALLLLAGCDTISHGSSPAKPEESPDVVETSVENTAQENTAQENTAQENTAQEHPAAAGADQVVPATDPQETVTAEPMPPPVAKDDGRIREISFDDVNLRMQADMVFRPWLVNDRVKDLEGRRIRITGVVYPNNKGKKLSEFVLLKNVECKFGPGGQADHLMIVKMKDGDTTDYLGDQPVSVEGVLRLNPFQGVDGNTWSIYDLELAGNVTVVRR